MIRKFILALAAVAALSAPASIVLTASPARAETQTYKFDPLHTQINFTVGHMGFSHPGGKFLKFDGGFTFDEKEPAKGSTEVVIQTDSLNMDDATWEEHVKSKELFDVAQYPTMTFKSTNVEMTGEKTAKITGDLTLHGQTHPVVLDTVWNSCGTHVMTKQPTCGFDATATIKRSEWGMDYGIPMVSDEVKIVITVEGSVQPKMNGE
jgi:polyisoprenoid-binding protein YceI